MSNVFIVNPSATMDELSSVMEERFGQATGICSAMAVGESGEDVHGTQNTFWSVEALIREIFDLHCAIVARCKDTAKQTG